MAKARQPTKVIVESVNIPGDTRSVDAEDYEAMKKVLIRILPREGPGFTQTEMWTNAAKVADKKRFPDHGKVGWWMKTVRLDLEAKSG